MLCPSSSRWKFQRSRIGKLPAIAWCLIVVCSATSRMLPASVAASSVSFVPSFAQSSRGAVAASQSTMLPSTLNSHASNTPITAVSSVIARM